MAGPLNTRFQPPGGGSSGGGAQGPAGPAGPTGPQGPAGADGAAGPANLFIQEAAPANPGFPYVWVELNPDTTVKTVWKGP